MESSLYEKLLNAGFRFVSFRPHSEREIVDFLKKTLKRWNVIDVDVVEKVLRRLQEYGHVDDAKFASWWITQRNTFRPKGSRAIAFELTKLGVNGPIIQQAITATETSLDGETQESIAKKAVSKKIEIWSRLPFIEQKKKIYSFLLQRGFSSEVIRKIIDETVKKDYNNV